MDPDAVDDVVARLLDGTCPEVRAATTGAAPAVTDVLRHHAPLERPTRHRMTVVGAAAQPVLPHTAQSASQALLDAGALGRAFDRADGRIVPALQDYARERGAARAVAAERALDFAALCHADGLLRRVRDRLWRASPIDATAAVVEASEWESSPDGPDPRRDGHAARDGFPGPRGPVRPTGPVGPVGPPGQVGPVPG
jgi:2-polyprenyl-6-methoxyphenol hydroxylase-like FAD-dependent oxidoreductase